MTPPDFDPGRNDVHERARINDITAHGATLTTKSDEPPCPSSTVADGGAPSTEKRVQRTSWTAGRGGLKPAAS